VNRFAKSLLIILAAIAVTLALLAAFRIPLAEAGLTRWMAAQGIANPRVTVTAFSLDGIVLADIAAGTDAAIVLERLAVTWTAATLLQGQVKTVNIDWPRISAAIGEDGAVRIPGVPLPEGSGNGGLSLALPLQQLELNDGVIALETPYGPLRAAISATYRDMADGLRGTLSVEAQGDAGHLDFTASLTDAGAGTLAGAFDLPSGAVETPVLRAPDFHGKGSFTLADGRLDVATLSLLVPVLELPTIQGGLTGRIEADGVYANGTGGFRLAYAGIDADRALDGTVTVTDIVAEGSAQSAHARIEGHLKKLAFSGGTLQPLTIDLPLSIHRSGDTVTLAMHEAGRVTAEGALTDSVATRAPVTVTLPASDQPLATLTLDENGIASVVHTVTATAAPTKLRLGTAKAVRTIHLDETRLTFKGRYNQTEGYSGNGTVANSLAQLDEPALAAQRIEADITIDDITGNGSLHLDLGRLADRAEPERFAAVGAALTVTRKEGAMRFVATVRDATQTIRATASGPWPLDGPRDEIFVEIPPIVFETGGKQPALFAPALAAFEVSRGRLSGTARIHRKNDTLTGTADLAAEDFAFTVAGAEIDGLTSEIHLDSLAPPVTAPDQQLRIARIDLGTRIDDIRVDYRVTDRAGVPELEIATARAGVLGGSLTIDDAALPLDGRIVDLPVAVAGLDVTQMLELLGVEGLEGSGALSGRLPLRLSAATAEIRDGKLSADGPGVLKLDAQAAADFLAAQGESVDLAIRALEDFHYTELTIDVAREAAGAAQLKLSMLGQNPAVLEGHPFRFNINLKSNVDELVAALLQGYRIATDRVNRSVSPAATKP
jgi:hypothetical protein